MTIHGEGCYRLPQSIQMSGPFFMGSQEKDPFGRINHRLSGSSYLNIKIWSSVNSFAFRSLRNTCAAVKTSRSKYWTIRSRSFSS